MHQLLDMPAPPDRRGQRSGQSACSFCGREQAAVGKLIAGPGVGICNDCVALATAVVRHGGSAEDSRTTVLPAVTDQRCSFCRRRGDPARARAVADSGAARICLECVDLCHEILRDEPVIDPSVP